MRLSAATAAHLHLHLPPSAARYGYNREAQRVGIVHFGIGAFHRAHQAWYTDLAMSAGERDWAICGVSLRSRDVAGQLVPQDGLYTLVESSGAVRAVRLIGAVREVLHAGEDGAAIIARLADPACHIVSFTVTEKGYARAPDGTLDPALAASSFYPLLERGLAERMARGLPGVTLLSCDNLAGNGRVLGALVRQWLAPRAPALAEWFAQKCRTPSTMVDRIVPRSDPAALAMLGEELGLADHGAVFTERFSQWVIEDDFAGPRPCWEAHGAQFVRDVAPYEIAKLRMLNGAHSLLAYAGLRAGHTYVHEAIADPALRVLAEQLMRGEALPSVPAAAGLDLAAYADALLDRFTDPALRHRLDQIAMDGTQKIPQRWLDTALDRQRQGLDSPAIAAGLDAWLWHLEDGRYVDDPVGRELVAGAAHSGRKSLIMMCFDGSSERAPVWPGYGELAQMAAERCA
ncbi:MAG: mannitol dehydrogenase family protein [Erythrobacteraceae bacterium]